jgi:hypothetical protein
MLAVWTVAKDGYRIVEDLRYYDKFPTKERPLFSEPPYIVPIRDQAIAYNPLGSEQLHRQKYYENEEEDRKKLYGIQIHRTFAGIDFTQSHNILKFANKYGLLGGDHTIWPLIFLNQNTSPTMHGESLASWKNLGKELKSLIYVWDMIEKRDIRNLEKVIIWDKNMEGVNYESEDKSVRTWLASNPSDPNKIKYQPGILSNWVPGDVIGPAIYYVCREVNKNLGSKFSYAILPFVNNELCIKPDNLDAAIWFSFAREVSGRIKFALCARKGCSEWFQRYDARQQYCSDACKMAAYRERKEFCKKRGGVS